MTAPVTPPAALRFGPDHAEATCVPHGPVRGDARRVGARAPNAAGLTRASVPRSLTDRRRAAVRESVEPLGQQVLLASGQRVRRLGQDGA